MTIEANHRKLQYQWLEWSARETNNIDVLKRKFAFNEHIENVLLNCRVGFQCHEVQLNQIVSRRDGNFIVEYPIPMGGVDTHMVDGNVGMKQGFVLTPQRRTYRVPK